MRTHGKPSTYKAGCRCDDCCKANTQYCSNQRAERRTRLEEAPHGSYSGYSNWGCRCEKCLLIGSQVNAKAKKRRKGDDQL